MTSLVNDLEAESLRQIWASLGVPGAIDIHTHFMPRNVMDKVWLYFDSVGPLTGVKWPINYRLDEERRVALLRGFGVVAFTSLVYPHKPGMAAWLNSWSADFAAGHPDCLHTGTFFPESSAADYVPAAIEVGTQIFKAHLQVGDYDPNDPLLEPVWGVLEDTGAPIVIHCGSGPTKGRFTGPQPIIELLRRHPRLTLIVAHLGMPEYADFFGLAEQYDNVHLDTTMAFTSFIEGMMPFPARDVPRLAALGSKILFGTDFPNIPHSYLHQVESLQNLDLGDEWLRAVVYGNARKLFPAGPGH